MAITIDPKATHSTEIEGATFHLRPLTGRQVLAMSTRISGDETDSEVIYEVAVSTLDSWEGVVDSEGKPIKCIEKNIELLPLTVAVHIFEFAASLSGLTGEEAGN